MIAITDGYADDTDKADERGFSILFPMKQVAIVGTQGVPANYGGFESLVENIIGENCSPDIQYTVFCSSKDMQDKKETYKGCRLKYIPLHANGVQSIPYDILSMLRAMRGYDVILVLGTSGCMFLPLSKLLSGSRIIVNIDGLEHRRGKWSKLARWVLRYSEAMAIKFADAIIVDNKGIQDYVTETYNKSATLIAYGGDHANRNIPEKLQNNYLTGYGLKRNKYAITVCRIEPENNCHIILEAFARNPQSTLVFVGNWNHSKYARNLKEKYTQYANIIILDAIYNLNILYTLRANAGMYIHGHSAGGTNPSLVEAMFFGRPIIAYHVIYNKETTNNEAYYFSDIEELSRLILRENLSGIQLKKYAQANYTWKHIAMQYEALY
jgi:glycosyltransferase involved in cell wall biosynthesis